MVAVIKVGSSIRRTFHYNENKVNEGAAQLIMVGNYPVEMENLSAAQRLNMLLRTAESNPNVRANSVHISLNFAVGEVLDNDKMKAIAAEYMEAIGFGNQPYLVYRHDDAAHPHLHIATVKVDMDGQRIETQNIGKALSEPARRALELKYGLVKAEEHKKQVFSLKPIDVSKIQYGKSDTKRAIGNVLENVLTRYRYTSLPELNAILNLYNVSAERGSETSRTYKNRGLLYRILDDNGKPVGVPVKASLFHNKRTLTYLEKQFLGHEVARQEYRNKVKATIDFSIKSRQPKTLENLADTLKKSCINMVLRKNKEGLVYGITFIDFKSKCVFNGSALGKKYSIKGIKERLDLKPGEQSIKVENTRTIPLQKAHNDRGTDTHIPTEPSSEKAIGLAASTSGKSLLDELMQYDHAAQAIPFDWKKKRKRKKKR